MRMRGGGMYWEGGFGWRRMGRGIRPEQGKAVNRTLRERMLKDLEGR
jgi:hypothetical protein